MESIKRISSDKEIDVLDTTGIEVIKNLTKQLDEAVANNDIATEEVLWKKLEGILKAYRYFE